MNRVKEIKIKPTPVKKKKWFSRSDRNEQQKKVITKRKERSEDTLIFHIRTYI